jgi:hypothetical protein
VDVDLIQNIRLEGLAAELQRYAEQWVAISMESRIVAHGPTYGQTISQVRDPSKVVLLKVPPIDASLAPTVG